MKEHCECPCSLIGEKDGEGSRIKQMKLAIVCGYSSLLQCDKEDRAREIGEDKGIAIRSQARKSMGDSRTNQKQFH